MEHPLDSFPIAETDDPEVAQATLSRELTDVRFESIRDRRSFRLEMNGVHLGRTMVGYNELKTDTVIDCGVIHDVMCLAIGIGDGPSSISKIDNESVVCTERGAIVSPSRRVVHHRPEGGGVFMIRTSMDAIETRLGEWLDRRLNKPIVFAPSVDLRTGVGAQVHRLLRSFVSDLQRDPTIVANPLFQTGFDAMFLNALLSLPNSCTDELINQRPKSVAPAIVRRAEEFLDAKSTEPVTMSDVVAHCGCSEASLYKSFRKHRGYTPMGFLAERRLQAARRALQSPSHTDNVTSVAFACGFSHTGRFSEAYRKRFGEKPSATIRHAVITQDRNAARP